MFAIIVIVVLITDLASIPDTNDSASKFSKREVELAVYLESVICKVCRIHIRSSTKSQKVNRTPYATELNGLLDGQTAKGGLPNKANCSVLVA